MDTLQVKRTRASTLELQTPEPESSIAAYHPTRVREGLQYAQRRLKSKLRKPTPNTEKVLLLYSQACSRYLEDVQSMSEKDKRDKLNEIRTYEIDMSNMSWIKDVPTFPLTDSILALRQITYYARYGDYAKLIVAKLRAASQQEPKTPNWEAISGKHYWTSIAARLQDETPYWKDLISGKGTSEENIETNRAVRQACKRIGIEEENMISILAFYGKRNTMFHSELEELIENKRYHRISVMLYDDIRDLASVCPVKDSRSEEALRAVLETLRDEWFDTSDDIEQSGDMDS
ncbi:MAG: hypothetical protein Q9225_006264 [Loekoesia sp. 1 TL-2023]